MLNVGVSKRPSVFETRRPSYRVTNQGLPNLPKYRIYNTVDFFEHPCFHRYCARFQLTESRPSCRITSIGQWPKKLVKGAVACVECQPLAMKGKLGGHCRGHGLYRKETRWTAVTVPGCHGKWVMTTAHEECQCDPENELSFILV